LPVSGAPEIPAGDENRKDHASYVVPRSFERPAAITIRRTGTGCNSF